VITVGGGGRSARRWLELATAEAISLTAERVERIAEVLREEDPDLPVLLEATALEFATGQDLLDWVAEARTELKQDQVLQRT